MSIEISNLNGTNEADGDFRSRETSFKDTNVMSLFYENNGDLLYRFLSFS